MHLEKLPTRLTECVDEDSYNWTLLLASYTLADKLMIPELSNQLVKNEIAIFEKHKLAWNFKRLVILHNGRAHSHSLLQVRLEKYGVGSDDAVKERGRLQEAEKCA